jgi:hypothetical protein
MQFIAFTCRLVVPRSQDPKRPLRSPKSHVKTKRPYLGLSSGSQTSPTQRICTESPEPHPGRVFIGEGQEAGLPILGANQWDIIQARGVLAYRDWFTPTVSWPWGMWPKLSLIWSPWAKACSAQLWLDQGWDGAFQRRVHTQVMVHFRDEVVLRSVLRKKEPEPEMTKSLLFFNRGLTVCSSQRNPFLHFACLCFWPHTSHH